MLVSIAGNQTDFIPAIQVTSGSTAGVHPGGGVGGQVYHPASAVHRELKRFMPGSQHKTNQVQASLKPLTNKKLY